MSIFTMSCLIVVVLWIWTQKGVGVMMGKRRNVFGWRLHFVIVRNFGRFSVVLSTSSVI